MEFDIKGIFRVFEVFNSLLVEGSLKTIEHPSLSAQGYQLLSLVTSQLVGKI